MKLEYTCAYCREIFDSSQKLLDHKCKNIIKIGTYKIGDHDGRLARSVNQTKELLKENFDDKDKQIEIIDDLIKWINEKYWGGNDYLNDYPDWLGVLVYSMLGMWEK